MGQPAKTISFAADIKPLFRPIDIDHMSWFCDLSRYEDVRDHANEILGRLDGSHGPQMPPSRSGGPWPQANVDLFKQWKDNGCAP